MEFLVVTLVVFVWWNVLLTRNGQTRWTHYPQLVWRILSGQWGYSRSNNETVLRAVSERSIASLELFAFALALVALASFVCSKIGNRRLDAGVSLLTCAVASVPFFMLDVGVQMLAILHRIKLPPDGFALGFEFFRYAALPGVASAICLLSDFNRAFREERSHPPVVALVRATARELPRFIAVLSIAELLFAWPGIGRLFYTALGQEDGPLVAGSVLFLALICIAARFLTASVTGGPLEDY